MKPVVLNCEIVDGFINTLLASRFDGQSESAAFHRECWELCTGKDKYVAIAAPRSHAKSTAITFGYGLSTLLFRERKFMLVVSDTESQASSFLGMFRNELQENKELIDLFDLKVNEKGMVQFVKDSETDIIVEMNDGHRFRVLAKGSEQKLRGLIWNGSRPDIILCHEEGTEIYTPETGWIKNTEHPTAQLIFAKEAYKVTFDDGHTEVVSGDHRFLTESGWKYIWEMKNGENVVENGTNDISKRTQPNEKNLSKHITINQRLKNGLRHGMQRIVIESILLERSGMSLIRKLLMRILKLMLKPDRNGKLLSVLNAAHVNSEPVLIGLPKNS